MDKVSLRRYVLPAAQRDYLARVDVVATRSEDGLTIKNEIARFRNLQDKLHEDREKRNAAGEQVLAAILDLTKTVKNAEFVDPEQAVRIIDALDNLMAIHTGMTELSAGKTVPMTDKTFYEIAAKGVTALAGIAKTEYHLNKERFASMDQVNIWLRRIIQTAQRYIPDLKEFQAFIDEFKKIDKPTAEVEIDAEEVESSVKA